MPTIELETYIEAPIERCFDLALSVDLHRHSVTHTQERPIAGVMSGVMRLGDTVTWEAVHFSVKQRLTTRSLTTTVPTTSPMKCCVAPSTS
jgi:hypothetical protein